MSNSIETDPDTYKKRLRDIRVSRISLKYLIDRFPLALVHELGEQGVKIEWASINQMMKEFNKKVSNLIFDLEAKDSDLNALWIEEVKKIYRAASTR